VDSAYQGEEGISRVKEAVAAGRPYALAFVDIRMPPGIDGVETAQRLWKEDEDLQVVLCSAYSDYSWEEMTRRLGISQRLLILRKPFDNIEVRQLAHALTEKWELLRQSHRRMEDLEQAVEERTRALAEAHEQLMRAQKLEALGRMSAGLAHEVNNPLSYVLSNLRHMQMGLEKLLCSQEAIRERDDLRDACRDAVFGAERIARIVQDVRLFARLEAPATEPVDVRQVVEHSISLAGTNLRSGIRLVRDFQEVPHVLGSDVGLGQVFLNLIVNAVHAMRPGTPAVNTLRVRTGTDGGLVRIDISDTGHGIPPEAMPHIFDPFFTTKPAGTGTGLGLSISHSIIQKMGGEIRVESRVGQGTTFSLLLPAYNEP
jgi:two-component system, NtrC family, sensor kinase